MRATTAPPAPAADRGGLMAPLEEDPRYLREQLLTYIGNKRSLLGPIAQALEQVKRRLGRDRLRILDAFSGSGVVSRFFKRHAALLISNDLEDYAAIVGRCYLANRSAVDADAVRQAHQMAVARAASQPVCDGFVRRLYAPRNNDAIAPGERVFYTVDNAIRIDSLRRHIDAAAARLRDYLLAPLLAEASVHANTAGVFKGFYKDARGVGQFGGARRDALSRILGPIELPLPIFSRFECEVDVRQADANALVGALEPLDVAYFDPPYNQHPYGSNYFMLNLIARNEEPAAVSEVSGIAQGWRRSSYNKRREAWPAFADLIERTPASHVLISYNSEGFIARKDFDDLLGRLGRVAVVETKYNAFRGSRNLQSRPIHVKEQLFLLERK